MNLHLMTEGKFVERFVRFVNKYYPDRENYFYIYNKEPEEEQRTQLDLDNLEYTDNLFESVDLSLVGDGKVFVHSFYLIHTIKYCNYLVKHIPADRIVLIIYGADLYNNRYILKDNFLHPGIWVQEYDKKRMIKGISNFMTFASPDFELMCKWYGAKGRQYDCLYPSNANVELLSTLRSEGRSEGPVRILLGNSATVTNKHMEALDWLSKYRDEDITIICPLSYGDMNYAHKVEDKGKGYFGDNFKPIYDYMSINDYSRMLNDIDIAIYNNNRQQATGNIEILGYLGKKIFVRSDTTTWQHYVGRDNCVFYDTKCIDTMEFEEFISNNEEGIAVNMRYFEKIWDDVYIKEVWDRVMYK